MARQILEPSYTTRKRTVLDPELNAPLEKGEKRTTQHVVKTPDGKKPKPEAQPNRRELVAIKAGQLVRIRGDRDNKYVVMADPDFTTRRENGMARGRVIVVEVLGPNGVQEIPIRYLIPVYA